MGNEWLMVQEISSFYCVLLLWLCQALSERQVRHEQNVVGTRMHSSDDPCEAGRTVLFIQPTTVPCGEAFADLHLSSQRAAMRRAVDESLVVRGHRKLRLGTHKGRTGMSYFSQHFLSMFLATRSILRRQSSTLVVPQVREVIHVRPLHQMQETRQAVLPCRAFHGSILLMIALP